MKFGVLKSDLRQGLVKFFNKNTYEALQLFSNTPRLKQVIVDIIKEPNSYCLRERICRETEYLRQFLLKNRMDELPLSQEFELAIKLITICTKYNPNYLTSIQNLSLVDILRKRWESLSTLNLDNLSRYSII